jgi:hypothetical protein
MCVEDAILVVIIWISVIVLDRSSFKGMCCSIYWALSLWPDEFCVWLGFCDLTDCFARVLTSSYRPTFDFSRTCFSKLLYCISAYYLCLLLKYHHYNVTSFFRFVDKRAIYRWYNLIRTCAGECDWLFHWQHKLCATFFTNVNINYRLPIKVYYCSCTFRHIRIE